MKFLVPALLILFISAGCRNNIDTTVSEEKKYKINSITEKELDGIINNRSGKILFINVWATWCVPCVEEFPDLVKTSEYYKDKDVDIISLNVDSRSDIDSLVIPFLIKYNVDFPVYHISSRSAEVVINLLNPEWNGAIPATIIYDKTGRQTKFILGAENYTAFRNAIDSTRSL